jgi:hypothetical protein
MNYTKGEYCLGNSCRFYKANIDAVCFNEGVLPKCSPALKQARMKLDSASPEMHEALKVALDETPGFMLGEDVKQVMRQALDKAEGKKEK